MLGLNRWGPCGGRLLGIDHRDEVPWEEIQGGEFLQVGFGLGIWLPLRLGELAQWIRAEGGLELGLGRLTQLMTYLMRLGLDTEMSTEETGGERTGTGSSR